MKSLLNLDDFEQFESVIFFDLEFTCWEDNNISNNWEDVLRPPEIIQKWYFRDLEGIETRYPCG